MTETRNAKWRRKHNITLEDVKKFDEGDWTTSVRTIEDVKVLLAFGREFNIEYKGLTALLTLDGGSGYSVSIQSGFEYDTDKLDDFGENAKIEPYFLKDIVGKWKITWHA